VFVVVLVVFLDRCEIPIGLAMVGFTTWTTVLLVVGGVTVEVTLLFDRIEGSRGAKKVGKLKSLEVDDVA
jgi:hypothetical protein